MSDDMAGPGIGHNRAPTPEPLLNVDGLADDLRRDWSHLFTRRDELIQVVDAWKADHPKGIVDEDDAKQATDQLGQVLQEIDVLDKDSKTGIRADVKRPVIEAGRIIDSIFRVELADKLRAACSIIHEPLKQFSIAKQRRIQQEQQRQREEAQRQANEAQQRREQEAQDAADRAAQTNSAADLEKAMAAEQALMDAEHDAPAIPKVAPAAEASRTYGDHGTMGNISTRWSATITDPAAVPRQYCTPSQGLIDAAMKASRVKGGPPTIKIPGVEFTNDQSLRIRRS